MAGARLRGFCYGPGIANRSHPMRIRPIAFVIALTAIAYAGSAFGQQSTPHLEGCVTHEFRNDRLVFVNGCDKPAAIRFGLLRESTVTQIVERTIRPGGVFETGMTRAEKEKGWLATVCPAGYAADEPFTHRNQQAIIDAKYKCVRQ
jgi:hypothetical protein